MMTEREVRETIQRLERADARLQVREVLEKEKRDCIALWVISTLCTMVTAVLTFFMSWWFIPTLIAFGVIVWWSAYATADAIGDLEAFEEKERLENA